MGSVVHKFKCFETRGLTLSIPKEGNVLWSYLKNLFEFGHCDDLGESEAIPVVNRIFGQLAKGEVNVIRTDDIHVSNRIRIMAGCKSQKGQRGCYSRDRGIKAVKHWNGNTVPRSKEKGRSWSLGRETMFFFCLLAPSGIMSS